MRISLVAFQVLPSVALWSNSHRTQALEVMTLPFWPMRELPGILVPGLITGVSPVPSFLNLAHLGFVTAALALVSLVRLDRLRLVLLILGVLGAMLSMGPEGGLSEIVQRLPVLGLFRGPFLYFLWVTMAVMPGQRWPRART